MKIIQCLLQSEVKRNQSLHCGLQAVLLSCGICIISISLTYNNLMKIFYMYCCIYISSFGVFRKNIIEQEIFFSGEVTFYSSEINMRKLCRICNNKYHVGCNF